MHLLQRILAALPIVLLLCAPAMAQEMISGTFTGCGFGQGILECRIAANLGREYYLVNASGNPSVASNISDALLETVQMEAWVGKQVNVLADLDPQGRIARVHWIALADSQRPGSGPGSGPASSQNTQETTTIRGVMASSNQGFTFHTATSSFPLAPGMGYRLGDLGLLYENARGRQQTLTGYFTQDANGPVFVVTVFE